MIAIDCGNVSKIGEALQVLLDKRGLNPNSLSKEIGIPRSSVYALLQKKTMQVDLEELHRIAEYFHVELSFFLDSTAYKPPVTLSDGERQLLAKYKKLTPERRQRLTEYLDDLVMIQNAKSK